MVVLFGSGETSATARPVYDLALGRFPRPVRVAVLETPAGFQPNSALVAAKVGDFLRRHLAHHRPEISIVPARKRGTPFSPDDEAILAPLLRADMLFMGAGSPTYAVRQLQGTLAWRLVVARQHLGAALALASAATIAAGRWALPVYEIYKAGLDLEWQPGLDFFGPYGLDLTFISHWDNSEGGAELDTRRCYMGLARFEQLLEMLPTHSTVVGIDEHSALLVDAAARRCRVMGKGSITILRDGDERRFAPGREFPIAELGPFTVPERRPEVPAEVWERVQAVAALDEVRDGGPPARVVELVERRQAARAVGDWATSDALRGKVAELGWSIRDTPAGPELAPREGGKPGGGG